MKLTADMIDAAAVYIGGAGKVDLASSYIFGLPATIVTTSTYPTHDVDLFRHLGLSRDYAGGTRNPDPPPPDDSDWELGLC